MAVFRVERTRDYTVMCNHHLKDSNLSLKAKGLLSMMLSLPDEWNYTARGLAAICKEGVDAIGKTLKELELAGYISIILYYVSLVLMFGAFQMMAVILGLVILMFVYVFAYPRYHAHQVMAAFFRNHICGSDAGLLLSDENAAGSEKSCGIRKKSAAHFLVLWSFLLALSGDRPKQPLSILHFYINRHYL